MRIYHRDDAGCPEAHKDGPWFFEPEDYDGGDVYSPGYPTKAAATKAAKAWAAAQAREAAAEEALEKEEGEHIAEENERILAEETEAAFAAHCKNRVIPVGTKVTAGVGDDADEGRVMEPDSHALALPHAPHAVYVAWDSGVRTWTPRDLLGIVEE